MRRAFAGVEGGACQLSRARARPDPARFGSRISSTPSRGPACWPPISAPSGGIAS